jgi:hypothetical protein
MKTIIKFLYLLCSKFKKNERYCKLAIPIILGLSFGMLVASLMIFSSILLLNSLFWGWHIILISIVLSCIVSALFWFNASSHRYMDYFYSSGSLNDLLAKEWLIIIIYIIVFLILPQVIFYLSKDYLIMQPSG